MTLGGTSTSGGIFVSRENALLLELLDSPDGHAKNYSILMATNDRYRLAPLYGLLSAAPLVPSGTLSHECVKFAMPLFETTTDLPNEPKIRARMTAVDPDDFLTTAEMVDVMRETLETMANKADEVITRVQAT